MALYILDTNKGGRLVRGSILSNQQANTSSLTWFDLSNPDGAKGPFPWRGGGTSILVLSVEGSFVATVDLYLSAQDSQPSSTLGSPAAFKSVTTLTAPDFFAVDKPWRWVAANVTGYSSGAVNVYVHGVL